MSSVSMVRLAVLLIFVGFLSEAKTQVINPNEPDVKPGERISSRVQIRNEGVSVPLKTSREQNLVKVSFPTKADRKYLVYSSQDLARWATRTDLVDGTGQTATVTYDVKSDRLNFIRVEEVNISPLPNMVWIRPGVFQMGSALTEQDREIDEDPVTEVTLTHGFWMGKYEVTQREYEEIVGSNPSWFLGNESRPVEQVAWKEAVAFCARLTEREHLAGNLPSSFAYRLPTEAEFEYAARAGTKTRFSFGDDPSYSDVGKYAWYNANSSNVTHPVGQKLPNAFGLYDMGGNVWEWCLDWYTDRYAGAKVTDPMGPPTGVVRVFRGGGFDYTAASCRPSYRNYVSPTRRAKFIGFRVVLGPLMTY